jgi:hypothetical protein
MLKYGAVGMLFLAGLAALFPPAMSWAYIIAFIGFELWLLRRMASVAAGPVPIGEPPYQFTEREARLVGRYRFYFTYPAVARESASVLAAIGLTALVISPWLVFRQQLPAAFLVAVNLLAVGALTRRLSPAMVLRIAASKGDRESLEMLEAHETACARIKEANAKAV